MAGSFDIMQFLDQIRVDKKITIQSLTKGIVSRRNYSRYLSGETHITYDILVELLNRMNLPTLEFTYYFENHIELTHIEEIHFRDAILLDNINLAYEKYYPLLKDKEEFKTLFGPLTVPLGIIYMRFRLNWINKKEALYQMKDVFHFDALERTHIIDDDFINALYIYINVAEDEEKRKIIHYLTKVIFTQDYKMFTSYYEQTQILIYLSCTKSLIGVFRNSTKERELLNKVLVEALRFFNRSKPKEEDFILFKLLYDFIKSKGIINKYIVFYYVLTILTSTNQDIIEYKKNLDSEDINLYISCLKENGEGVLNMYEGLMAYGIF